LTNRSRGGRRRSIKSICPIGFVLVLVPARSEPAFFFFFFFEGRGFG
jgi:hypothetical protein